MARAPKVINRDGKDFYSLPAAAKMLHTSVPKLKKLISSNGWELTNSEVNGMTFYVSAEDIKHFMRQGLTTSAKPMGRSGNKDDATQLRSGSTQVIDNPKKDSPREVVLTVADAFLVLSALEAVPSAHTADWYARLLGQVKGV